MWTLASSMFVGGAASALWTSSRRVHASTAVAKTEKREPAFNAKFKRFKLGEVVNLAEDVAIMRFLFDNANEEFYLPACSTLQAHFSTGGASIENVTRFYTPITPNGAKGYFDIIIKRYNGGRMTEHMFGMQIGDSLEFRHIQAKIKYMPNKWKQIGMICAGTGITPMLQVLRTTFEHPEDRTYSTMLFCNKNERKILLKGVLDEIAQQSPQRFKVHYLIDQAVEPGWTGGSGYIDKGLISKTMPPPSTENIVLVCGPDAFVDKVAGVPWSLLRAWSGGLALQPAHSSVNNLIQLGGFLKELGYTQEMVYKF